MVLLNWCSENRGNIKFKYNVSNSQWINIDTILSTVTLTYQPSNNIYSLDPNDAKELVDFVAAKRS